MEQVLEVAVPLYTIKYYNEHLYKVCKRLFEPAPTRKLPKYEKAEKTTGKFDSALSRARNIVRDLALCNDWQYFVTLTFDERWYRYSLPERIKEFMQWVQNENKQGKRIRYLLVPEFHKDGAVHFHALMAGIDVARRPDQWPFSVNLKKKAYKQTGDVEYYDHWPQYSARYGFSSVEEIKDPIAVGFYISKYITKSLAEKADFKGVHTYYRSKGLRTAHEVGGVFGTNRFLDGILARVQKQRIEKAKRSPVPVDVYEPKFYETGFFRCDEFVDAICLCDEVNPMYQSYVISDPVSGEIVAVTGGDDDDIYVQQMIAGFEISGLRVEAVPIGE